MKMLSHSVLALAGLAAASAAGAATTAAFGTLSFDQQFGTATSTDAIPVFLTLTLDPASAPLTTDPSAQVTSGLTDQNISDAGYDPAVYTSRLVNEEFSCSGSFTSGCGSPTAGAYHFNFNFDPPSFVTPSNFDLEPGSSYSFLFGTFVPNGHGAAPGTYQFANASIIFELFNADQSQEASITLASTCASGSAACSFTRVVTGGIGAVPEPASWALMLAGFGLVGATMRRRAGTVVAA